MKIFVFFFIIICLSGKLYAKSVVDAYEALKIYNYFEAKRIFEKKIKKYESPCSFGLATIYFRKDNPFHNLDSAYKYALKSENGLQFVKEKLKIQLDKFGYNELEIASLKQKISSNYFQFALSTNSVEAYQKFLDNNPWSNERFLAIHKRDSLVFYRVMEKNTREAFVEFLQKYPESEYVKIAKDELYLIEYEELTPTKSLAELMKFIEEKSTNPYVVDAENMLYKMQTKINTVESYANFIQNFPTNRNVDLAWRRLFQTYMYVYSEERIESFKREFPNYPFQNELSEESNLNKQILLPYKQDELYGWMTDQGEIVSVADFESLNLYKEGLAQASRFGKIGFVDKNNRVVIPFEYDEATDFEDGRSIVEKRGKVGIIDRTGKLIFDVVFEDIGTYSEGMVFAKKDSLFGYYDKFGNQLITERFNEAFSFQNGIAQVVFGEYENFVDRLGNLIFPIKYERITKLSPNLFSFQEGDYFGLMNLKSTIIQPPKYDEISTISEGKIAFSLNGKVGYFDENGTQILAPIYDARPNISNFANFTGGYARAILRNKWGIIDQSGKWVVQASYSSLGEISDLVAFKKELLWGYINLNNKIVVEPTYDEARSFDNEVAIVSFNNRFGILDIHGTIVLPIIFDYVNKLNDQLYYSKIGDKLTLLFKDGTPLSTDTYKQIRILNKDYLILTTEFEVQYFNIKEMRLIKAKN